MINFVLFYLLQYSSMYEMSIFTLLLNFLSEIWLKLDNKNYYCYRLFKVVKEKINF